MLSRIPPSTKIGALEAPLSLVETGKIDSGLMFMFSSSDMGTTVSWAPESATAGLLLDLPGLWLECLNLGKFRPRAEYDGLSTENVTCNTGLSRGLVGIQPETLS